MERALSVTAENDSLQTSSVSCSPIEDFITNEEATQKEIEDYKKLRLWIEKMNTDEYSFWSWRCLPSLNSTVRSAIEIYAHLYNLPLPLGYESRSHLLFLRFRNQEEGDLWIDAPDDKIFGSRREPITQFPLEPPRFRSASYRWRPQFADGSSSPVFVCDEEMVHKPVIITEEQWVPV